ncbi:acyltransferase family protein [Flavitalea antarctica]
MTASNKRINGFDALRTIAMWLGIILHSIIVYKTVPEANWPNDSSFKLGFLDWLYEYIHFFRMPLFFLVAGFFARLVILKYGGKYFIMQRFKRIVVPFIAGVVLLVPISLLPFHYYRFFYVENLNKSEALSNSVDLMRKWNGLVHLWFLYYLIIFYLLSLLLHVLADQNKRSVTGRWERRMENLTPQKLGLVTILLFVVLYAFNASTPPVNTSIRPNLFYLIYYGIFYACGWLMQINMKSVVSLIRYRWFLFLFGTVLSGLYFIYEPKFRTDLKYSIAAIVTVSLLVGITGLFMKYFTRESYIWRYLSDAAYWVYLIHIIIVVTCQVILIGSSVPGVLRLPIVILTTFALSLTSYHYFVRYTKIGEFLHGKRIPRDRPRKRSLATT